MSSNRPHPGPVFVVGGGMVRTDHGSPAAGFVQAAGGVSARIGVVPTASESWRSTGRALAAMFDEAGASESRVLLVRDRYDARSSRLAEELGGLTGLFFSGGDQTKLVRALRDSSFLDRVKELWRAGMAVGGTSAGASAMSATMIASGRSGLVPRSGMVRLGEGLGFLDRLIVDQHFGRRNRLGRLLLALNRHPELTGVGLCEGTALSIDHDGTAEVIGERAVFVLQMERTLPGAESGPGPERVNGARLQVLVPGDRPALWRSGTAACRGRRLARPAS